MMNEESSFGASFQDQNARSNSYQAYLQRAASAVEEGDIVLGIHLYMAAYERALREDRIPNEAVLEGMSKAWDLAIRAKQRSLAEYIFEKLESFWTSEEMAAHAEELQQLAFDKLEEYGFDRNLVEDVADMVSQDLLDATDDVLCRFEDNADAQPGISGKKLNPSSSFGTSIQDLMNKVSEKSSDSFNPASKQNAASNHAEFESSARNQADSRNSEEASEKAAAQDNGSGGRKRGDYPVSSYDRICLCI